MHVYILLYYIIYRCIYVNIQKNQDLGAQLALRHLRGLQLSSECGTHTTVKASFGLQVKPALAFRRKFRLWLSGQTAELFSGCSLLARKWEERLVFHCRTSSTTPWTSRRMCCPTHCAGHYAPCQPGGGEDLEAPLELRCMVRLPVTRLVFGG